jgi:hypothetical protein
MSEQQTTSACLHPEAVGTRWGDPISRRLVKSGRPSGKIRRWWKSNRMSRMPISCGLFPDLTNHR